MNLQLVTENNYHVSDKEAKEKNVVLGIIQSKEFNTYSDIEKEAVINIYERTLRLSQYNAIMEEKY